MTAVERALSCSDLLGHIVHHLVGSYAGRPVRASGWQQYCSDWLTKCLEQVVDWSNMRLSYLSDVGKARWFMCQAGLKPCSALCCVVCRVSHQEVKALSQLSLVSRRWRDVVLWDRWWCPVVQAVALDLPAPAPTGQESEVST